MNRVEKKLQRLADNIQTLYSYVEMMVPKKPKFDLTLPKDEQLRQVDNSSRMAPPKSPKLREKQAIGKIKPREGNKLSRQSSNSA
ncbi:hypothetical protein THRCLA_23301 [Thraustotheca clavata]|uniref:Uncharacterized protein n=1 Tax=Thraustotheca clavata TaxID=74557 RepID=A0A1V9Y7S4_9STRA|nr:hypothetical protein THRCLA_23301 [Thraustotheca clavata]